MAVMLTPERREAMIFAVIGVAQRHAADSEKRQQLRARDLKTGLRLIDVGSGQLALCLHGHGQGPEARHL